jgi:hypothetical protein
MIYTYIIHLRMNSVRMIKAHLKIGVREHVAAINGQTGIMYISILNQNTIGKCILLQSFTTQ